MFQHNPSLSNATSIKIKKWDSTLTYIFMLTTLHSYSSGGMISKEEENNLFSLISKSLHLPYTRGSKQRIMTNQIGSNVFSRGRKKRRRDHNLWRSRHHDRITIILLILQKFKYLRSIFTSLLKDDEDIKRRISQAWGSAFVQTKTYSVTTNYKQ